MVNYLEPAKGQKLFKVEIVNLFGGGGKFDITPYVVMCSIYSSIDHPFMSISCTISDEDSILRRGAVNGDKSLLISITDGAGQTISGTFHINSMTTKMISGRKSLGVEFIGMTAEHLNNASQKVQEWTFRHNPQTITNIVKYVFGKYLKGSLQVNVSSSPAVNIDIPRQTPMQAIGFLLERAAGSGKNMFVLFQKFIDGKPKFCLDEVSKMASAGPIRKFLMTESNMGEQEAHTINKQYVSGAKVCRILVFSQDSAFNVHDDVQQGYVCREYSDIDYINKICTFTKDKSQPVTMGSPQHPEVNSAVKAMASPRETRTIYEPRCGDESYYVNPNLSEAYLKPKTSAAGFINKRITMSSYGCTDVNPGDVIEIDYPINDKDPQKTLDPEVTGKYLVLAARHSVSTNGEVYSQFELGLDGKRA
jgi:hypothetical protein